MVTWSLSQVCLFLVKVDDRVPMHHYSGKAMAVGHTGEKMLVWIINGSAGKY